MLKPLDHYTRFMDPDEYNNMKIDTSGELMGVGIELTSDEKTKKLTVVAPIENTPAAKAGILARDIIIKIDGKNTEGMDTKTAVQLIRGPKGTTVTLTIQRSKEVLTFPLTRDRIEIHPVRFNTDTLPQGQTIGYIRLVQFSQPAVEEMRQAIQDMESQQVKGYILDLRSNPGGLLHASIEIARMWLSKGTIVSTVTRQGEVDRQKANNTALTNKPLVVLVDGGSASASEIVSGALQDNKRGKVVGLQTFGKGLVQSVMPLRSDDGQSAMAVTIAGYRTPNGRDINKHGIDPDVEVKLTDQQRQELSQNRDKVGTSADPQFAKAVEVLLQEMNVASAKAKSSS
jgi:carboxyl-terminal processing protease